MTLIDLLRERAEATPEKQVYAFLAGADEADTVSFSELDRRARAIGAALQRKLPKGERALLAYPPGLAFISGFLGCLYGGILAVPAYPPSRRSSSALRGITSDAQPAIVLTDAASQARFKARSRQVPELKDVPWLATDTINDQESNDWRPPRITADSLAFLQYTSGSTAAPKGVMVRHGNLLHNEKLIQRSFSVSEESVIAGWLPLYHDMGLIGNVLQPLYAGASCVLMSPVSFLQSPVRWLRAISDYQATISGGPDFAYSLCAQRISAEDRATLDLSSWQVAFNGAEPVRVETLDHFAAEFESCGFRRSAFYPCYGLAEATLCVTGGETYSPPVIRSFDRDALEEHRAHTPAIPSEEDIRDRTATSLVGSGRSRMDQEVAIVDPSTCRRCPPGQVGEIWVSGPSVAGGYWRREAETLHDFQARLCDEPAAGPFLRTGDLGILDAGELFVTGRLKDLIIIRGRNLYPHDIERTAELAHPALRTGCCAAFSVDIDQAERLVVVSELERGARPPIAEVATAIRQAVTEERQVQTQDVVLLRTGGLPKTSSGKIRRRACRQAYLDETLKVIDRSRLDNSASNAVMSAEIDLRREDLLAVDDAERRTLLTSHLRHRVAQVTGYSAAQLDPHQPLTRMGLDSLQAVEIKAAVEADLDVEVSLSSLLEGASLVDLLDLVLEALARPQLDRKPAIARIGDTEGEHPLSYGQQALWFLHRLAPSSSAYHITVATGIHGPLDLNLLHQSFALLVERHPMLRTRFVAHLTGPMQVVQASGEIPFHLIDDTLKQPESLATWMTAAVEQPFDLERGPLLRILVRRLEAHRHELLLVVHHAVADFWSLAVLFDELGQVYSALRANRSNLPSAPAVRYTDFVRWQADLLAGSEGERLESYWRGQLTGELTPLALEPDRPRPAVQTYRGASCDTTLSPEPLELLSQTHGTTLYMTLLAGFQALLSRITGQTRPLVGSPSAGRGDPQLADVMGYFVNPLVLRGDLSDDPSFTTLLSRVRRTMLDAFQHQDYPFDRLVERLQPARDPSRSPVFQAMLTVQQTPRLRSEPLGAFALGQPGAKLHLGGLEWQSLKLPIHAAPVELTLAAAVLPKGIAISLQYNRDLFDATTVERWLRQLSRLIGQAATEPDRALSEVDVLGSAARHQLRVEWNATDVSETPLFGLHQLVERSIRRHANSLAVSVITASSEEDPQAAQGDVALDLTYAELGHRTDRWAAQLQRLGIGPEAPVAILTERDADMVTGILAILSAGGAYVPLDPRYPDERLAGILADVYGRDPKRPLLTQKRFLQRLRLLVPASTPLICLDDPPPFEPTHDEGLKRSIHADQLAYVIYTSGSTGKPKGVQIRHRSVVNFLHAMARRPGLAASDTLMAVTTLAFDISVLELFLPLIMGGRTVLADAPTAADGRALAEALDTVDATVMQATPTTWRLLLDSGWSGREGFRVLCGGEALPSELAARLVATGAEVWNMYGPTETTVWSTTNRVNSAEPSIGAPIDNTQLFLLDRGLRPVPTATLGEVFLGGVGLARGYFQRSGMTAERFVPNPFSEQAGGRLYRVGDLARFRADGALRFEGRVDHQVKLRGFRIELGEIESRLAQHPAVSECAVVLRRQQAGDERLVAYLVAREQEIPPATKLREFLAEHLPDYMLPSSFVTLAALPRTANEKIDRRALPSPTPSVGTATGGRPRAGVEATIARLWHEVLDVETIGRHDNFFDLGGHSLLATNLHLRLCDELGRNDLRLVDLFRYPTIAAQASFLEPKSRLESPRISATKSPTDRSGPFAIIGMAGRFPGASDVASFWENLRQGVESITFFSPEEMANNQAIGRDDPDYVPARGVLDGAAEFDAAFFGFNPREAELMDPQHRLFLECAWQALEDAGYDTEREDRRVGVFAGVGINTYLMQAGADLLESADSYQAFVSNDKDFVPTRVSYKLNLRGPSINVQTACSSGLVAVHLACRSLADGESDMALAGGVTVRFPQRAGYLYQEGGILSPDGHCRAFDAHAGGTVIGNGAGIVVLKRLEDALADGDTVRAVILGSAINNDGSRKVGYTAPSVEGQIGALREALSASKVMPETISYVEAHGTGTALGDPIELEALNEVYGGAGLQADCALGSVKTNIGHLDTAAGIAGLIKTVLALEHREIPANLHFESPGPKLDLGRFSISSRLRSWPDGKTPRRAGVSSFGIGGTNAHLIVEEAPTDGLESHQDSASRPQHLLLLSARSEGALDDATSRLATHLETHSDLPLADVAYTLKVGRRGFNHRRVIRLDNDVQPAVALRNLDPERVRTARRSSEAPSPVFLFPGQGAQYATMGYGLYQQEIDFRCHIDRCAELLEPHLELDLRRVLFADGIEREKADRQLRQTSLAQPALFTVSYALAQLWTAWGVQPRAMIGHSIGEWTAACLAGVLSLEDALALVALRGRLLQETPTGAMLAVALPESEITPWLGTELTLAAVNSPTDCVVSGNHSAVDALEDELSNRQVRCRRLHTSHAFHSALIGPAVTPFVAAVAEKQLHAPKLPFISNVTGTWIRPEEATDPAYWGQQIRQPVLFAAGISELLDDSDAMFLEVGPGHGLSTLARLQARDRSFLASLPHVQDPRSDAEVTLDALSRLWLAGFEVDWNGFYQHEQRCRVPLPTYPFERRRFFLKPTAAQQDRRSRSHEAALAKRRDVGDWFYTPVWNQDVLPPQPVPQVEAQWLVFGDGADGPEKNLAAQLTARLRQQGQQVVTVTAGARFERLTADSYIVARDRPQDLETLFADAEAPDHIVLVWPVAGPPGSGSSTHEINELLQLVQTFSAKHGDRAARLSVLSVGAHRVTGEEHLVPERAMVGALLRVVEQEMPHLTCRSIDLALPEDHRLSDDLVADLLRELTAPKAVHEIALRHGGRWRRRFEPLPLPPATDLPQRLRNDGAWLITGGLGGVGLILAQALVSWGATRLVLVGRTQLPQQTTSDATIDEALRHKFTAIESLKAAGADVLLESADVCDPTAMTRVATHAEQRFGAVRGVIHAAGVAGGGLLQGKNPSTAAEVLAPKVDGLRVLLTSLTSPPDVTLLCSSINAVVGGFGQGDYAAANAFLDAYAQAKDQRWGPRVVSLSWDRWHGVGMAAETVNGLSGATQHPLLGTRITQTPEREVYRSEFAAEDQWVLSEHRIAGHPTVPGATYLEMVRAAVAQRAAGQVPELRDIVFLEPMVVKASQRREVLTVLDLGAESGSEFRVISRNLPTSNGTEPSETSWQEHARGRVDVVAASMLQVSNVAEIRSRCQRQLTADEALAKDSGDFLATGQRWQCLEHIFVGEGELLAELALPEAVNSDLRQMALHPALLDVGAGYLQLTREGNFLPLAYERLCVHGALPSRLWSHLTLRGDGDGETISCDVRLLDADGRPRVTVDGFAMKRVGREMVASLERAGSEADRNFAPEAASAQGASNVLLEGVIEPAEGVEVLRRVLAVDAPAHLVISPRDLSTVQEAYRRFDHRQVLAELENLEAPRVRHARPTLDTAFVAPGQELERQIAEIWQRQLGIDQVGIHDNFFELGGTSLIGVQVVSELKRQLGQDIPATSIFEAPTVGALAKYLEPPTSAEPVFVKTRSRANKKKAALARQRATRPRRRRSL